MQVGCRCAPGTAQTGQSLAQLPTPQRAFQSGGRVLGGSRPSFQLLTCPRKNVPATFSRCCRFPKFILHTECCAAGQQSGATSHSLQTSLKTFTDAGFPAASFHSVGIVSMWVPSELEGGSSSRSGQRSSSCSPKRVGAPAGFVSFFHCRSKNAVKCGSILAT